jgi:RimJ/RimL family protein N-acetyltransferase
LGDGGRSGGIVGGVPGSGGSGIGLVGPGPGCSGDFGSWLVSMAQYNPANDGPSRDIRCRRAAADGADGVMTDAQPVGEAVPGWQPRPRPERRAHEGRYCRLEPLDVDRHLHDLWIANSHDTAARNWTYLVHGPYASVDEYEQWMRGASASSDPLFFAVIDRASARAAGVAAYLRIAPEAGSIEVGHINFSPLLQRTRAATDAMYLMMKHAFELGYRRYEWKCDALNQPSRAAAERLGLTYEGTFRQALVYKGRNRDSAWYAAIDKEWPALRRAFESWLSPGNFDERGEQRQRLSDLTARARAEALRT